MRHVGVIPVTGHDPNQAKLHLFVGCFVASSGLFIAWNDFGGFALTSLMLVSLGGVMLSLAAVYALPDGPGLARKAGRVLRIALILVTVSLAITGLLAGVW